MSIHRGLRQAMPRQTRAAAARAFGMSRTYCARIRNVDGSRTGRHAAMMWVEASATAPGMQRPMRLTVYTDYALRALMYAALHPDRLSTIGEIAGAYGISRNHVMKVVYELGVAGYIETVRGQQGGIRLARAPGEIGLGDVVRRTEGQIGLVPCMDADQPGYCAITSACKLRRALQQASNAFFAVLDDYTLADLTENDAALRGLLPRHAPKADASLG